MYFLAASHPIRQRAVELLPVREAYDAARARWEKEASAIDALIAEPLKEEDRRAFEVIRHPVFTLHEVRLKISIAQETYLFDHDAGDEARDAILRDVLAIANEEGRA